MLCDEKCDMLLCLVQALSREVTWLRRQFQDLQTILCRLFAPQLRKHFHMGWRHSHENLFTGIQLSKLTRTTDFSKSLDAMDDLRWSSWPFVLVLFILSLTVVLTYRVLLVVCVLCTVTVIYWLLVLVCAHCWITIKLRADIFRSSEWMYCSHTSCNLLYAKQTCF